MMTVMYVLFLLSTLFKEAYTQDLVQQLKVSTWAESRHLCNLAGKADLCDYSTGYCVIKLTDDEIGWIFSFPLWINGFVSRPPWIIQEGCTEVKDYLLPNHYTENFKLDSDYDINECVSLCGSSKSYGVSGSFCYCLRNFRRTSSSIENCREPCHANFSDVCKKNVPGATGAGASNSVYLTEYTQHQVAGSNSLSPWNSCAAASTSSKQLLIQDCREELPFICIDGGASNNSVFQIHNTPTTWYNARKACYNADKILINEVPFREQIRNGLQSNKLYWTGAFRPLRWTWDEEDMTSFGKSDCLVLNKEENGTFTIQTRNCTSDGISGLCMKIQSGNSSYNFSFIPRVQEAVDTQKKENSSVAVYIGIGVGAGIVALSVLVIVLILARKRLVRDRHAISGDDRDKSFKDAIGSSESIPLDGDGSALSKKQENDYNELDKETESPNSEIVNASGNNEGNGFTKMNVDVTIEPVPYKHKNKKSKSDRKKKKRSSAFKELDVVDCIEDESVTIVDDGTDDTELSQNV